MYSELIDHLQGQDVPLRVPRRAPVVWDDEAVHTAAHAADPTGYALLALLPGVTRQQRARVLLRLLDSSWAVHDDEVRATLTRVVRLLQAGLPGPDVATVLLALRRRRANHKHVTRAVLDLLTTHPQADALVRTHRAVLVDCLEHGLGKATARGAARRVGPGDEGPGDEGPGDEGPLARRLRQLYAGADRPDTGPVPPSDLDGPDARPATVTVTNRGDVAATLVHALRGGTSAELEQALDRYVGAAAAAMPAYPGTVALVLDRSESMRGYGDREWATVSQAEAFRLVLERRCGRLVVVPVGDPSAGDVGGVTDLATGLLDAVEQRPDVVAVVSDGYENTYPGDLARVAATLPRAGVQVPVVFWHSTFGHSDDLSLRRPAPRLPQRAFWHEADLAPLLVWTIARVASGPPGDEATRTASRWLREALHHRLTVLEAADPGRDQLPEVTR